MLDIGWSELVLIGVVALIFVGPKDLPRMFHALGRFTAKARGMAREFQRAMDDAAKSSGLDDVRKDLNGLKTGLNVATNPAGAGINALEDAARKFEKWDPKTVLKPAATGPVVAAVPITVPAAVPTGGVEAAPVSGGVDADGMGAETRALAEKRAAEVAAARAKAHDLQAKAAQSASATFAARAKADAEAAAARAVAADGVTPEAVPVAVPVAKAARVRKPPAAQQDTAEAAANGQKPARKPPVKAKKSDA